MKGLIEAITLLGGAAMGLLGVFTSLRERRREDRKMEARAGIDALQQSKIAAEVAQDLQGSYMQQITGQNERLRLELNRTQEELEKCYHERARALKVLSDAGIDWKPASPE